jgi:hypothetical protein
MIEIARLRSAIFASFPLFSQRYRQEMSYKHVGTAGAEARSYAGSIASTARCASAAP